MRLKSQKSLDMNKQILITFLAIAMFAVSIQKSNAQAKKCVLDNVSVNANFGSLLFYGDIKQYDYYPVAKFDNERSWGGGLSLTKTFNSYVGLQGQYIVGGLKGTKRNLASHFTANISEYSLSAVVNLSNVLFPEVKDRKLTFYGYGGIGIVSFRSQLLALGTDKFIAGYGYSDTDEKVKKTVENNDGTYYNKKKTNETVFPLALGLKYRINGKISVTLESSLRSVNTDKLDSYKAIGSAKDKYGYTSLGISYKFITNEAKDPEWITPIEANAELSGALAKIDGLSKDADGDGVADFFDQEPSTPEGISVDGSGKSLDIDGDGIADYLDADPFTAKGAVVDEKGVEKDADGDGVVDSKDLEQNSIKGSLVNFQGITIDKKDNKEIENYLPSLFFPVNVYKVSNYDVESVKRIAIVAQLLQNKADLKLKVIGYADATGSADYNIELSKKRAEAVVEYLVNVFGIDPTRLTLEYKGEETPLAKGLDYINRRVDFKPIK